MKKAKGPKPRKAVYEIIALKMKEPWELLEEALEFHPELHDCRIALAWRKALKPDIDGHLVLGKCVKVSELNQEFSGYDFIVVLNREIWDDPLFTRAKKLALLDHELCHAMPAEDQEGEQKADERGRLLWRTRKHDIEEFQDVITRHGCYKRDLEQFAEALQRKRQTPLLDTDQTTVHVQ